MLNANALRAEIARNGMTQNSVAKSIGISANTFSSKMKTGKFGLNEVEAIAKLLNIDSRGISAIFFNSQ